MGLRAVRKTASFLREVGCVMNLSKLALHCRSSLAGRHGDVKPQRAPAECLLSEQAQEFLYRKPRLFEGRSDGPPQEAAGVHDDRCHAFRDWVSHENMTSPRSYDTEARPQEYPQHLDGADDRDNAHARVASGVRCITRRLVLGAV